MSRWLRLTSAAPGRSISVILVHDSNPLPATAGETAYERIRHDIVFGGLAPGSRLKLDRMRLAYGASISTLREILSRLSAEGLILAEGQRGFSVPPVSQQDFRGIAAMRELLETHAMAMSFRQGDVEWEAAVMAAHHRLTRLEARMQSGDRSASEQWKRYDWEFHRALLAACGSTELLAAHARIFDLYLRYQMIAVIYRGEIAATEHRELAAFALARDHEGASRVLHRHINACVEHTIRNGVLPAKPHDAEATSEVSGIPR